MNDGYVDCANCQKPILKTEAQAIRWFEYLFYSCSRKCHNMWTATLLGRKNITEAECR